MKEIIVPGATPCETALRIAAPDIVESPAPNKYGVP